MIDLGRKKDMEMLMTVVNDVTQPLILRRRAFRRMQSIKAKLSDKTILRLRLRLIAATIYNDIPNMLKISERLQEYEVRNHLMRKF